VLNYPDLCVKLRDKVVFEVKPVGAVKPVVASEGGSAPKPAPRKAERVLQQDAEAWMTDVPAALARARSEQRKVFLFFTGSDWCGWCKKLDGEILSTPEFRRYAESKLVLVKLDFPRSLPQSEELKTQNRALAKKYQIRGYPTVVVLDAEGRQVGQLGYQRGGPKPFIEALGGLQ
jgi:protein disulfide-isomerase